MIEKIPVNDRGFRVGQYHPRATLTDHEVEQIRQLNEQGMSYRIIAEKFETSKSTIQSICTFLRRNQTATRLRLKQS